MNIRITKPSKDLNVVEVGVGDSFSCKSISFWGNPNYNVTLFEPNPLLFNSLHKKVRNYQNVTLHNVAIYNETRKGTLVMAGVLSYLPEVASPINTIFQNKLTEILTSHHVPVDLVTFDQFDSGNIDMLLLGMEGAESTVFEKMKSKPHVIILNNHFANDYAYAFPNFRSIQEWCLANRYEIIQGIPDMVLINLDSYNGGLVSVFE